MQLKAKKENIPQFMDYVKAELEKAKLKSSNIAQALLSLEELLSVTIDHSNPDADISLRTRTIMGMTDIKLQATGEPFDKSDIKKQLSFDDDLTQAEAIVVNELLDKVSGDKLRITCRKGIIKANIRVEKSSTHKIAIVLGALVVGLLLGFLIKATLPAETGLALADNIFIPVYTIFLNALKLVVGPLVFISIANSMMEFDDMKTLGKIAGKVFVFYVCTSLMAIGTGYFVYNLFKIGNPTIQGAMTDAAAETIEAGKAVSVSIKDLIVGCVPTDIVSPFLELDMLQIIFMAVIFGIAVSLVGRDTPFAKVVAGANKVALKLTEMIIAFLPLSVFCSMAKLGITMKLGEIANVAVWVPVCYAGHLGMLIVYALLLLIVGIKPSWFYRSAAPAIMTAFATSSSNATMPVTMDVCKNNLKISPKVYAFSIPFGATVNMDGSCVTLIITALFMAKSFGIAVTMSMLVSLLISIMALSMGAPGIPGAFLVSLSIILPMIGVPAEAISLILGLHSLVGMTQTVVNVTGDAVVTTIVAKTEKLLLEE